jgi:hypothetical protein
MEFVLFLFCSIVMWKFVSLLFDEALRFVGFEIFVVVKIRIVVIWVATSYSLIGEYQRFEERRNLNLNDESTSTRLHRCLN